MKLTCITLGLAFCTFSAVAQSDSAAPVVEKKPTSYLLSSISWLSNSVYNGRKDSVATPYLTPVLGYYHKSGLFADASVSYLAKTGSSRIDLVNIEAGYAFSAGKMDGELAANKSFYNSQSTNVQSQIQATVNASVQYDLVYIQPGLEAGMNFSDKTDYTLSPSLEHSFYAFDDRLRITSAIAADASTLNYYSAYYNKRKLGGKKKNAGVIYDVTAGVEQPNRLKLLDYQFKLPVLYSIKHVTFIFSPVYIVPVNPAVILVTLKPENGGNTISRTANEKISNSFIFSFSVSYKF